MREPHIHMRKHILTKQSLSFKLRGPHDLSETVLELVTAKLQAVPTAVLRWPCMDDGALNCLSWP